MEKIVFFGHNQWAVLTLKALVEKGFQIVKVVSETDAFDAKEAENYARFEKFGAYGNLKKTAGELGLPFSQPEDANSPLFQAELEALNPDLIICVSYHTLFKKPLLKSFEGKMINAHIAPLPHYRGRAPLNWAILNGETRHGLTIHLMNSGIDTGPILHQEFCDIFPEDRAIDLLIRLLPLFPAGILRGIELLRDGFKGRAQNRFEGSYFPKRTPQDGHINFSQEKIKDIYNKVRALAYPYPGAFIENPGGKIILEKVKCHPDLLKTPVPGVTFGKSESGFLISGLDGSIEVLEVRNGERVVPPHHPVLKLGMRFL